MGLKIIHIVEAKHCSLIDIVTWHSSLQPAQSQYEQNGSFHRVQEFDKGGSESHQEAQQNMHLQCNICSVTSHYTVVMGITAL